MTPGRKNLSGNHGECLPRAGTASIDDGFRIGSKYLEYRRLRAPRESGTALFEPAWDEVAELMAANVGRRAAACYDVQGKCLSRLAGEARAELLNAAKRWTSAYRDVDTEASAADWIFLAGHQPQVFHPGVWLKNFALSRLAKAHGATAVNLIVDSDTIRGSALRVPGGSSKKPTIAEIPFDAIGPVVPFEERAILDRQVFASFSARVQQQIEPLVARPLVGEYWALAQARAGQCDRLGTCLAQARHLLEQQWGGQTLELPQSMVCESASYRWFLCHLLEEAPRFRQAHNEVLRLYRRLHRIRSQAHPVADLAEHDGWREVPFWIWETKNPRRRRLFVRQCGRTLRLTNRHHLEIELPLAGEGDASRAVEKLEECSRGGVRIRSRALITTMWARLAMGDIFVHGIGGAKYDQVTDALIARFFGISPPDFLTVSGTLHLPVPRVRTASDNPRTLRDRLRRLQYQPERFLDGADGSVLPETRELAAEKRSWIDEKVTSENYRERYLAIRRLNERMQASVAPLRERTHASIELAEAESAASAVLTWREYGFCLYPAEVLQIFFDGLLPK